MRRPPIKLNELLNRIFWPRSGERGQAMIFVAVLLPVLSLSTGLVVEGGQMFAQYRKLQAAADMAALVGAQKLPCATTDTTCITTAETQACTYATNNGFSGCSAGGGSSPSANVPPVTCSPYDFIDYGNDNYGANGGNTSCKSATGPPPYYDYVEARLTYNVGTVPIFNIPITLAAHAVAKHGTYSPGDFAIISLSPTIPLNVGGSGTFNTEGSSFANDGISSTGNGLSATACNGGWFSASGSVSTAFQSDNSGVPVFAPANGSPNCTGNDDSTPLAQSGLPQISDPYSGGTTPPTQSGSFPNCTECQSNGWWYDYDNSTWSQGGSPNGSNIELFPGIYTSLSGISNGSNVYLNPGVYTFTNGWSDNHGSMCVFGSPSCSDLSGNDPWGSGGCATQDFSNNSTLGNQWNYQCSPYGFWDSSSFGGTRPSSLPTAAPTFYNSSVPLNGVTFYFPANAGGITFHGNGGKNGNVYVAAPNGCPGTGSYSGGSPPSVSWPNGAANAQYSFEKGDLAYTQDYNKSPSADLIYPNSDFSLLGECNNGLQVWQGEQPAPKHLQFLFWMASGNDSTMNGASGQQYTGIIYMPSSNLTILGAGKGAGGPPWIDGQLIVNSATTSGNSYVDVNYRPCGPNYGSCGSGLGTELIE